MLDPSPWALAPPAGDSVDLFVLSPRTEPAWEPWLAAQPRERQRWLRACGFEAAAGQVALLPAADGSLAGAVIGLGVHDPADPFAYGSAVARLPPALYAVNPPPARAVGEAMALGWAMGARGRSGVRPSLVWPTTGSTEDLAWMIEAEIDARQWAESPACDLSPGSLVALGYEQLTRLGAACLSYRGAELRALGYPGLFHVGKGSARPPALLDATWGPADAPRVTLVGKGVCFDAGGVNVKSFRDMAHMKTDMAGAAQALALARLLIKAEVPIRLRLLLPAADNLPSGSSALPGDVIRTRKGLTIEMVHTDYEGRVLLADALSAASEDEPDLLVDFATLTDTGLGPALAGFFTEDDNLAQTLSRVAAEIHDPVWRLPLWQGYADRLRSPMADLANRESEGTPIAAIAAALFLAPFAAGARRWIHFDFDSWSAPATGLRPEGANVAGLRATYSLIRRLYA
ncbi:MAG TPA: M17 family metallopeptidase [Steroidobacteraceae bacterium]|nr:M17 family metallopeptidase [Steroidobacteraceae bacterium]